jgi:ketosteroid isomerase-like protein
MESHQDAEAEVRAVLELFRDGYRARDVSRLDDFMDLFVASDDAEMIGIGAGRRGGEEWFEGRAAVRQIVESDWTYWGDVNLDLDTARITVEGAVSWVSLEASLIQTSAHDEAMPHYLEEMTRLLADESTDVSGRMMEATHFGLARLRERHLGPGYEWRLVITAVLGHGADGWRFHTLHWSTPP